MAENGLKDAVFGSCADFSLDECAGRAAGATKWSSRSWCLLVLVALGSMACAGGRFEAGVYRNSRTAYRIGSLDSAWTRFDLSGSNLAFRHRAGGSILANATCEGIKDVPLDVLVNQALFGIEQKHELGRDQFTLDGRAALRVRLSSTLDGVPVNLDLVAVKKDDCAYDLELVAAQGVFSERDQEFWSFVQGFQQLPVNP